MKLTDVIKQQGIKIEEVKEIEKNPISKRRYFWDEEEKPVIKDELNSNKELTETRNKELTENLTRNKPVMEIKETRNVKVIKGKQSTNKPVMETQGLTLDKVSTHQREILQEIFEQIQNNPIEKETGPLNIKQLGNLMGYFEIKKLESLRIVILRLEKSGFLVKTKVKTGRSGWTCYTLPNQVFEQLLNNRKYAKPVIKNELTRNKELTKPVITDHSKKERFKELNNTYIQDNFPNVQKIGFKENHLNKTSRPEEEILEILTHYEHSLQMNEVKVPAKLPVLISIITDSTKTWVSESYLKQLNAEFEANQKRVEQLNLIKTKQAEEKLRERYEEYVSQNPNFKKEVLQKQPFKNLNDEVLEKICFEEFKLKMS